VSGTRNHLCCPEKCCLSSIGKGCKGNLIAETLELGEAAALEAFGAVAVEVIDAEFAVGGLFAEQVVGDFEDMAAHCQHCSSMPYVAAQATIACAEGSALGAASSTPGFHERGPLRWLLDP
jgi:hypothetical protein